MPRPKTREAVGVVSYCNPKKIKVTMKLKPEFPPVYGTDLEMNTTKLYASKREFASEIGVNPVSFANWFRLNPDRPFKGRYRIEAVNW